MSHFTSVRTQIRDEECLVSALADVGFSPTERHAAAQSLHGYRGDIRPQTAEVIIRRQHVGAASNDIGFKRQADGAFAAIISEFDRAKYSQLWLDKVAQRYAYHVVLKTVNLAGHAIESIQDLENGEIEVVVCENF